MDIYQYSNYRDFLSDYLASQPHGGRGLRAQWAEAMGCQVAYISHVMSSKNHLSLEQAEALSRHLGFDDAGIDFFVLLVEKERAGSVYLKKVFLNRLNDKIKLREDVRKRMKINEELSIEDQALYYSKWYYTAIHMALTIPQYQTAIALSEYFKLPLSTINSCLNFLEAKKLIKKMKNQYSVVGSFLHLSKSSPLFYSQQNFFRHKAIDSIFKNDENDLHFASCFSVSAEDIKKVKEILLASIEKTTDVIKPSKEEKIYSICLDLFEFN